MIKNISRWYIVKGDQMRRWKSRTAEYHGGSWWWEIGNTFARIINTVKTVTQDYTL
jgi:hypothetical protein